MTVSETVSLLKRPLPPIRPAPWTKGDLSPTPDDPKRRLPQAIAHRGFKALYPENTMAAFTGAIEAGTDAIETDLHLSSDGVVVISHDRTLKRCFGVDKHIRTSSWSYLSSLRTLRKPHQPMPRLVDLLNLLAEPENAHVWLLLDLKLHNPTEELVAAVSRDLQAVSPHPDVPWDERVVIGCWNQPLLHASLSLLPTYSVAHTSFSTFNSSRFLRDPAYPGLSFSLYQPAVIGPWGNRFLRAVRAAPDADDRHIFLWTVNEPEWMDWAIRKGVDGVITDNPEVFLRVRKRYEDESTDAPEVGDDDTPEAPDDIEPRPTSWGRWARLYLRVAALQVLLTVLMPFLLRTKRFKFTKTGK
ncbi:hypothetical protein ACRALDRAFT_2025864 [Sodiomyces alcalophilus JCM 7366]|uniref:uncharacterized protein n=1 Tax=Sodiomyces alcalophilus JCM 7366 TaxID=591952 RepID=UPI0039B4540B